MTDTIYIIAHANTEVDDDPAVEALAAVDYSRQIRMVSDAQFYFAVGSVATDESVMVPPLSEIRIALPAGKALSVIGLAAITISITEFSPI